MEGQRGPEHSSSFNKFEGFEGTTTLVPDGEESGWTQYLEDFSTDHQRDQEISFSYDQNYNGSPSMVSDAASPSRGASGMSKFDDGKDSTVGGQHLKKLNVKKQRSKKKCYLDHDLEDTASSPVNSPKVSGLKHTDINNRIMDDSTGDFLGKKSSNPGPPLCQADERRCRIVDGKNGED